MKLGCGVLGILPKKKQHVVLEKVLTLLDNMKNRGDDGSGLLFLKDHHMRLEKWIGTAQDIPRHSFDNLMNSSTAREPDVVLGHARYATKGKIKLENNHPLMATKDDTKVALVVNGETSFTERWRKEAKKNKIDLHEATIDSVHCAGKILSLYLKENSLSKALKEFYKQAFPFGGFTILGTLYDKNKKYFFYLRGGLRPLHYAKVNGWLAFFSETSHLNNLNFEKPKTIKPGEIGLINLKNYEWKKLDMNKELKGTSSRGLCPFELTYFQNYDSKVNGITVDSVRREFGKALAREHPPQPGSVISWVPKSGINATQGYFKEALKNNGNVEFRQVITRMPTSRKKGERSFLGHKSLSLEEKLRNKFKVNKTEIKNEKITLVDDSIVRGNVSKWIIIMMREANPKNLTFMAAWPPMIGGCWAGIELEKNQLIANKYFEPKEVVKNQKKLEKKLSEEFSKQKSNSKRVLDKVCYVSIQGAKKVFKKHLKGKVCTGCFEGNYSYIHPENKENPPQWLKEFIKKNRVELPKEVKL